MAGLGRRSFVAGEILTAANVQGYLQDQAVMVFASAAARDAAIPTPSEGMTVWITGDDDLLVYNGTVWTPPTNLPWGLMGRVVLTSDVAGLSSGGGLEDCTGFTVAVAAAGGRLVRVSLHCRLGCTGSVGSRMVVRIRESSTVHVSEGQDSVSSTDTQAETFTPSVLLQPSAGVHTYKVSMERTAGTGSIRMNASSDNPAYLLVEDVGPA